MKFGGQLKKYSVWLSLGVAILSLQACSSDRQKKETPTSTVIDSEQVVTGGVKQDYLIDVMSLSGLEAATTIKKTGRLMGSQEITLSAQAGGRIRSLGVKKGDYVAPGRVIASLSDTNSYGISIQRANVGVERAQLTYNQTKLQLDNAVKNAQHARDQSRNNYDVNQQKMAQQLQKVQLQLNQAQLSGQSATALQIEKLETEVQNQLDNLSSSFQLYHIQSIQLQESLYKLLDQLYGMTSLYENQGTAYEPYLGASRPGTRFQASVDARRYADRDKTLTTMNEKPSSDEELRTQLATLESFYTQTDDLLDTTDNILQNSLAGGPLTEQLLSQYTNQRAGLEATYTSQQASFIQYRNQVNNLFAKENDPDYQTTLDQQIAITKLNAQNTLDNAELLYKSTVTNAEDTLFQLDLAKTMAQESYDLAVRNRDAQLALLGVAIKDAKVNRAAAQKEYAKLSLTSPINGVVSDVLVDKGADVSIGTPIARLVGTENNEITITLDENQRGLVQVGTVVDVLYQQKNYQGTIAAIGVVADQTFGYPVTINVEDITTSLGGSVSVMIPLELDHPTIPLTSVQLLGNNQALIYYWDGKQLQQTQISVGNVRGDQIEVLSELDKDKMLILTDMSSYDEDSFVLKEKK